MKEIFHSIVVCHPGFQLVTLQDQRHPVMHRLYRGICLCSQDYETVLPINTVVASRHKQNLGIRPLKRKLLFRPIPLPESFCRDHASSVQDTLFKSVPLHSSLRPGVDQNPPAVKTGKAPDHLLRLQMSPPPRYHSAFWEGKTVAV